MNAITQSRNTAKAKFFYSTPDNAVLYDIELSQTEYHLYNILVAEANRLRSNQVSISIPDLAFKLNRCDWTIQRWLRALVKKGILIREFRKSPSKRKYRTKDGQQKEHYINQPSLFTIVGRFAPRYDMSEYSHPAIPASKTEDRKMWPGWSHKSHPKSLEYLRESKEPNITWEAELPVALSEEQCQTTVDLSPTKKNALEFAKDKTLDYGQKLNLSNVPDILKPTATLLLHHSGHTELTDYDVELLKQLLEKHYPARINREIETQAARFREIGRNPKSLHVSFIHEILKGQRSRPVEENTTRAHKKASRRRTNGVCVHSAVMVCPSQGAGEYVADTEHVAEQFPTPAVPELSMPLADAEKVIAEYEAEQNVKPEPVIPVALAELFEQMKKKAQEHAASLPKGELEDDARPITLEEYLRLKCPEAEDEELHRDYYGNVSEDYSGHCEAGRLTRAFDIDYACATCTGECRLPNGYAKGQIRPVVHLLEHEDGYRYVGVEFGEKIKCKHGKTPEQKHMDAEFEDKMRHSGLTQMQSEKTFSEYAVENALPEIVVAKAKAIEAARSGQNLILAGNAGTGKTHLAIAIAIEAMKNNKQAYVRTVPELLDEICQAAWNGGDKYGLLAKYKKASCLVLDDLGKENLTNAKIEYLYEIVDYRYTHGLQTVVTTNARDVSELESRWYPGRMETLMSRLLENGDWVTIAQAENHRLSK